MKGVGMGGSETVPGAPEFRRGLALARSPSLGSLDHFDGSDIVEGAGRQLASVLGRRP